MFIESIICIFVLLILIYYHTIKNQHIEYFVDDPYTKIIKINELKFGVCDSNTIDFINTHKVKLFPLPLPLHDMKLPTKNNDIETLKELHMVMETSKNISTKQKQSVIKYENDTLEAFTNYCKNHKLIFSEIYLKQMADDIKFLCYQLKLIYNRPRPYQLGFYVNIPIIPLPIINSYTPSYPSYSTLLSKILAYCISYNNPNEDKNLHNMAKEVELSRLLGGYNYPSDNSTSLFIADILKKYIKYYENT